MRARLVGGTLLALLAVSASWAQPLGTAFTYQGRLDNAGSPADGLHDLRFTLHSAASGGSVIAGPVCSDGVNIVDGLFTVPIDFGAANANFNGEARWLEIEVRADATPGNCAAGTYTPLTPRQPLTATPYALQTRGIFVDNFGRLGIGTTSPTGQLTVHGGLRLSDVLDEDVVFDTGNFYIRNSDNLNAAYHYTSDPERHEFSVGGTSRMTIAANGNVGIGVATPSAALDIAGTAKVSANASIAFDVSNASTLAGAATIRALETGLTGNTYGVFAVANSTAGIGVLGRAAAGTGATTGVYGQNLSTSGYGVFGNAQATSGTTYGVFGMSASPSGYGVLGESQDNVGVRGNATGTTGLNFGIYGRSESSGGRGVYGLGAAGSGTTYGVYGQAESASGRGVFGFATDNIGTNYGVMGETNSLAGYGVYGANNATGGIAYAGYFDSASISSTARAVFARTAGGTALYATASGSSGVGVHGTATFGDYGVYGNSQSGWGVYANGDFAASGAKLFRIDHPFDPENKYLLHYCAEGSEPLNIYSGTARLDGEGQAWVELPHYFSEINRDPRIQLTPAGASMPDLYASEEVVGNRFQIAGGRPNGRVYWEVKATRNDLWIRTRGAPVETDKPERERGKYQHPELYGQPQEKGMNYEAESDRTSLPAVFESTPR